MLLDSSFQLETRGINLCTLHVHFSGSLINSLRLHRWERLKNYQSTKSFFVMNCLYLCLEYFLVRSKLIYLFVGGVIDKYSYILFILILRWLPFTPSVTTNLPFSANPWDPELTKHALLLSTLSSSSYSGIFMGWPLSATIFCSGTHNNHWNQSSVQSLESFVELVTVMLSLILWLCSFSINPLESSGCWINVPATGRGNGIEFSHHILIAAAIHKY